MIFEERFTHVTRQFLWHRQTLRTASGLSIRSNSTSWTGFHEALKGEDWAGEQGRKWRAHIDRFEGMIAPIGGVLLIAGWLALAISVWRGPGHVQNDAH